MSDAGRSGWRSSWIACSAGLLLSGLAACGSCNKGDATTAAPAGSASSVGGAAAVAEVLPRCRGEAQRLALAGEDLVVGDVAIGESSLLLGVVRRTGDKRVASVIRASLDLATSTTVDIGAPLGDDPPPSPRWHGSTPYVAFFARRTSDAGSKARELAVARLEADKVNVETSVLQQADESTAFDIAWNDSGVGLVAWDEDAPLAIEAGAPGSGEPARLPFEGRGFVKVQVLGSPSRRVASPPSSDAESPRLSARPGGGFWLAWLARRAEPEAYAVEGPGEKRAFRWVEVVPLTAAGEAAGPVRRVSPEKGRAAGFELARSGDDLVVMVQDEVASAEGAGDRVVRYVVGENIDSADVVDGGVGSALAEIVPAGGSGPNAAGGAQWLAWTDLGERTHMTPLGKGLVPVGRSTAEPALDGARVLAATAPDAIYALIFAPPGEPPQERPKEFRPELRRFGCPPGQR